MVEQEQKHLNEKVDKLSVQMGEVNDKLDALIIATTNSTAFQRGVVWLAGVIGGAIGVIVSSTKTIATYLGFS